MIIPTLTPKELEQIKNNKAIRRTLARKSHYWFFSIYLGHYIKYPFAPFHHEMFTITEDESLRIAILVAFRASGKTTIMSLSYPIWAIIGVQQKKFVLIITQTQAQAKIILANIKKELEYNELLKADIGPFEEASDEWGATSIILSRYNARISVASTEQSIRGLRHGQYRPDLVVNDDVEDLQSVKTKEGRDKTFFWLTGEIMPIGDQNTKLIIVGNLLHEDSLIMRLKRDIEEGRLDGVFKAYPLITESGEILWQEKFPNQESIDQLRKSVGNEAAFQREYLLHIVPDEDQVVHPQWIHSYEELPDEREAKPRLIASGADLAISQNTTADFTAIVSAYIYGYGKDLKIYILPYPLNKRITFPQALEEIKNVSTRIGRGMKTKIYIEDVGYQSALPQQLVVDGFPAESVKVFGQDKRARLALTTDFIKAGKILFPKQGVEDLIQQLTGFGVEKHDDLVDAFTLLIIKIMETDRLKPGSLRTMPSLRPIWRNFGDGPVDVSKPLTFGLLNKKF